MIPKFRAWYEKKKEMHDVTTMEFLGDGHIEAWFRIIRLGDQSGTTRNEVILLLSTGLKDENGNEIFEGDIVFLGDNFNSVVRWNEEEAKFELYEPGNYEYPRVHEMTTYTTKPKIVGNIFEHPERMVWWGMESNDS